MRDGLYQEPPLRRREIIRTTLGELIVALTDEVRPFIRDPSGMYMVVSWILADLLARHCVDGHNRLRGDASPFAEELKRESMR